MATDAELLAEIPKLTTAVSDSAAEMTNLLSIIKAGLPPGVDPAIQTAIDGIEAEIGILTSATAAAKAATAPPAPPVPVTPATPETPATPPTT